MNVTTKLLLAACDRIIASCDRISDRTKDLRDRHDPVEIQWRKDNAGTSWEELDRRERQAQADYDARKALRA